MSSLFRKKVNSLSKSVILGSTTGTFQYKIFHNVLFKYLFTCEKFNSALCSLCKTLNELISHFYYGCLILQQFWNQIKALSLQNIDIPFVILHASIFFISWYTQSPPYLKLPITYTQNLFWHICWKSGYLSINNLQQSLYKFVKITKKAKPSWLKHFKKTPFQFKTNQQQVSTCT